jgi:hypothetical protein
METISQEKNNSIIISHSYRDSISKQYKVRISPGTWNTLKRLSIKKILIAKQK